MIKDYELATCGLSCDLCDSNTTKIQTAAKYLFKIFEDPMFQGVLLMTNPGFNRNSFSGFLDTLDLLLKLPPCPGCRRRKECPINQCAEQKKVANCSECNFFDLESGLCKEVPVQSKSPMMPPAPVFFHGISKRYRNWNVENLQVLLKGDQDAINEKIDNLIKEGKTSRDIIDFSVNLFESPK